MFSVGDISFHPLFPVSALAGLAAVIMFLTVAAYWRARAHRSGRLGLALLRCISVFALMVLLMRPMRAESATQEGQAPILAVVVDQSASMKTEDVNGATRDAAVREAITASRAVFERDLAANYVVKYFTFSNGADPVVLDELLTGRQPSGDGTDLSTALMETATVPANRKLAGLVLFSDGRDNAGGDVQRAATYLKGMSAGIWTVPVGSVTESNDLYVTARLKQSYLYVNQTGAINVTLSHAGFQEQYANVSLYRDDLVVANEKVVLTERGATIDFPVKEQHKGVFRYKVAVTPFEGESDTRNNERTVFARVVDEKTKVLLVEARPYWDSKFLLRALQHDPNIEVTSVFQLTADKIIAIAEKSTADPTVKSNVSDGIALPRTRDELFYYDCLILGKGVDQLLTAEQLALVRDFVRERGGGVIFARARSYGFDNEALAALEPLVWQRDSVHGERFELTPEGKMNPAFLFGASVPADVVIRELPEMVSVTKVAQEKSLSVVLARSAGDNEEMAIIAYQRYGKGKVMSVGATGLWRWAIMPQALAQHDDIYARFWGQMVRWLVSESDFLPGQEIAFRTDRYTYNLGDVVRFVVRTKFVDAGEFTPKVSVNSAAGKQTFISLEPDLSAPGSYSAGYLPDEEGEFDATLVDLPASIDASAAEMARFTVYSDSVESRFVSADPALLDDIAALTGGRSLALDELDALPGLVTQYERLTRMEQKHVDIWDRLGVFTTIVAILAIEWFIRRRSGLV
ncbi:MAG: hypothetical protein SGI88_14750 [Candidatus Hydrogenedentes bacterium]|nr:hypothetical protein [Candidatus Hydrogenedentota bacterium]